MMNAEPSTETNDERMVTVFSVLSSAAGNSASWAACAKASGHASAPMQSSRHSSRHSEREQVALAILRVLRATPSAAFCRVPPARSPASVREMCPK